MVKDGMDERLLSVNANYLSFADRIFNKYKDIYAKQKEEQAHVKNGKNIFSFNIYLIRIKIFYVILC